jgi:pyruvate dehydrogenase E1 component beta subunit
MTLTYREALRMGLYEALEKDERVFLMGEDVGKYGGTYAVSKGMLEKVMTVNFSLLALDQIVNTAAILRHMSGGQFAVPLVIRMSTGAGRQLAAQHSHSFEGWYAHIPGIKIVAAATIDDARGMLGAALRDANPVIVFEYPALFEMKGDLSESAIDIASASVRRPGSRVTLITYGACLPKALQAAEEVDGEVIDLRVLRPLDTETILNSVRKTRHAVVVDEGWKSGSLAAEIMARIMEQAFYDLDAPVARVCREEVPIPYPKHLEEAALPQPEKIVAAAKAMF